MAKKKKKKKTRVIEIEDKVAMISKNSKF
jgi:hypothetical protein